MNRARLPMIAGMIVVAFCVHAASEDESALVVPPNALRVDVGRWYDVDTPKKCLIHLPYGVIIESPDGIRDSGFDGWEVGNRPGKVISESERRKGEAARDAVIRFAAGKSVWVVPPRDGRDRDVYGRPLGTIGFSAPDGRGWVELRDWARTNGHVRSP